MVLPPLNPQRSKIDWKIYIQAFQKQQNKTGMGELRHLIYLKVFLGKPEALSPMLIIDDSLYLHIAALLRIWVHFLMFSLDTVKTISLKRNNREAPDLSYGVSRWHIFCLGCLRASSDTYTFR